jgi:hypothetical protein
MKQVSTPLATLLGVIGFTICAGGNLAAGDAIVVQGTVKEVTAGEKGGPILGEVLVEVDSMGKYIFLLRKDTKVSLANKKLGKWSDLKTDQRVSVTYNGIVAPNRPPQAGADEIAIEIEVRPRSKQQR